MTRPAPRRHSPPGPRRRSPPLALLAALAALLLAAPPARAQQAETTPEAPATTSAGHLVLSLSKARVTIASSFSGDSVVLFGVIEPTAGDGATQTYDVVATVRGPNESFVTWRKERRLGMWVNVDSRSFLAAPSYLAVLSNRPPATMADLGLLRREQAGLAQNRLLQRVGADYADVVPDDPFRQAFLRVKQSQGLYVERTDAVEFIAPRVFQAAIPIPGIAPIGTYTVDVKVFADRALLIDRSVSFEVAKIDFEQAVATAAQQHAWLYGLATALGALAVGFIANLVFRRD
ncbi:TIGR02186 family protein [Ancylobacter mangrovi]|uniref:TIGR02186 family protein n=1 Tax=Ancylobacter mangrovi TaxID=2972472 RepID=UPI00216208BE|nr:TIGR02186 family protein [Ancylobacter mangrovi]MCS0501033.1 TIGR02186 family protein [Ancylobacter mangrovi]